MVDYSNLNGCVCFYCQSFVDYMVDSQIHVIIANIVSHIYDLNPRGCVNVARQRFTSHINKQIGCCSCITVKFTIDNKCSLTAR